MTLFKNCFSFNKKQVDAAFTNARQAKKIDGIKLLSVPLAQLDPTSFPDSHGKLLIVIPKASGKAHDRNLLKRRIKAIFFEEKLYEKPLVSIILLYKTAMNLNFDELKVFLMNAFKA